MRGLGREKFVAQDVVTGVVADYKQTRQTSLAYEGRDIHVEHCLSIALYSIVE